MLESIDTLDFFHHANPDRAIAACESAVDHGEDDESCDFRCSTPEYEDGEHTSDGRDADDMRDVHLVAEVTKKDCADNRE